MLAAASGFAVRCRRVESARAEMPSEPCDQPVENDQIALHRVDQLGQAVAELVVEECRAVLGDELRAVQRIGCAQEQADGSYRGAGQHLDDGRMRRPGNAHASLHRVLPSAARARSDRPVLRAVERCLIASALSRNSVDRSSFHLPRRRMASARRRTRRECRHGGIRRRPTAHRVARP